MTIKMKRKLGLAYCRTFLTTISPSPSTQAPCDKLWVRTNSIRSEKLEALEPFATKEKLKFKRPFYFSVSHVRKYVLHDGQVVVIYSNGYESEIQINPTQWSSMSEMEEFFFWLLGASWKAAKITKLHLHIDLTMSPELIKKTIRLKRLRSVRGFGGMELFQKESSGKLKEVKFTVYVGSRKRREYAVYDASKQHGFPSPCTRIERRDNCKAALPIHTLAELRKLAEINPFSAVSLEELKSPESLSGRDLERYEHLDLLIEKYGVHRATARLRARDPKHFHLRYARVIGAMKSIGVDLNKEFIARATDFIERAGREFSVPEAGTTDLVEGEKVSCSRLLAVSDENSSGIGVAK